MTELRHTLRFLATHKRAKGDPSLLAPRLEREIADLSRDLPIAELQTMRHSLSGIFGYFIFELGAVQAAGRRPSISSAASMCGMPSFSTARVPSRRIAGATHEQLASLLHGSPSDNSQLPPSS
jgi:hypothetical protein